ncbi:Midasin [Wickerhamomyces ciferrii]|uniref:Midasin n=1 Tax=Wickerhamomyces ciferrii (strain ATCC 14091 / BCRC 22168 / CBS 111 / JCM 3599 / NBRC 0793 / NRRL Y-1031 F-60-10) TaxID=1206466 RepID=K0KAG8_WICCF|nr:Midasin [Wickerhamomyces ciferrii]CCH41970.1 Midasin [Wickerhamomyces ciferrii]
MARKKSATKKAREEAEKAEQLKLEAQKKQIEEEEDSNSNDEESEESEEEDDFGELITEDVDQGIEKVLQAIKTGDKALFDPKVRFFKELEEANEKNSKKEKPIYLKDYHRMNLLSGDALKENEELDQEEFKTYDQEKQEERDEVLSEIKNAFAQAGEDDEDNEDDDEDDGFLKKKESKADEEDESIQSRLPNPEVDEEKFLLEFANKHAWIPQKGDKIINLDKRGEEDDEEFDDAADKFENAYNFRYEDPNAAEIISYARNQATVRRNETGGRRLKREKEKQEAKKLKEEQEKQINKKKNEKVNKLANILEQIKNDYGAEINEDLVKKISNSLLDKDFDDSQWDNLLQEIFNDDFYNDDAKKPTWDDDDEIMKDFKPSKQDDDEDEGEDLGEEEEEGEAEEETKEKDEDSEEPPKKKSKKDELKEKKDKKKEKKRLKELAEKAVEANKLKLVDQIEEEREGRSKEKKETFKYREVSPETFGLTTREILIADDTQLNEFVGLKKYAPYRPKDQRIKDRRKLAKAKQLKEWRKKVFKNENGPQVEDDKEGDIKIPVNEDKKKKNKKRKHNKV